jgi:hypothetical protein
MARILCILFIVAGIIGLKLTSTEWTTGVQSVPAVQAVQSVETETGESIWDLSPDYSCTEEKARKTVDREVSVEASGHRSAELQ